MLAGKFRKTKEITLKIGSGPVVRDRHSIHFLLVLFLKS